MSDVESSVRSLEVRVSAVEQALAVDAERHRQVVSRLDKIDAHINKLMWLIVGTILVTFLNYALKGGFNGVV